MPFIIRNRVEASDPFVNIGNGAPNGDLNQVNTPTLQIAGAQI